MWSVFNLMCNKYRSNLKFVNAITCICYIYIYYKWLSHNSDFPCWSKCVYIYPVCPRFYFADSLCIFLIKIILSYHDVNRSKNEIDDYHSFKACQWTRRVWRSDSKRVIGIHTSKDGLHNGQKKKNKTTKPAIYKHYTKTWKQRSTNITLKPKTAIYKHYTKT
jgi:hypothetical protein